MTKLEEILEKNRLKTDHYADQEFEAYGIVSIESAMKEYAAVFSKEVLKIAAGSARLRVQGVTSLEEYYSDHIYSNDGLQDLFVDIDVNSILNIKLPEHD